MIAFLIRTWLDLTRENGKELSIACSNSFEIKKHPIDKKIPNPKLNVGDLVYVYYTSKQKKPDHIPGNGLYCMGKVIEISLDHIQIHIERRVGNVALNDDHEKLKLDKKHTEFYRYMKANCHEGYNILSEKVAQELDEFLI